MKKGQKYSHDPIVTTSYRGVFIIFGMLALFGLAGFYGQTRINKLHKEIFNSEAPLSIDFSFEDLAVIARSRITSQPKVDQGKWKELPFMSQPLVYRVTHKIGFAEHSGTIELKVGDNKGDSEFLGTDVVMNFVATGDEVVFDSPPFSYEAQGFRLSFQGMFGSFSSNGHIRLKTKELDLKMVNYNVKFSDVSVDVPADRKSITILSSKILLDDVSLDSSKIVFMGTNPFEVKLDSSFKTAPVEIHWNLQKTVVYDQDVRVGSGKVRFPAALLDAYVEPKINRLMMAQEKDSQNGGNEKVRFLFSAAKDVRRAQAKAAVLRQISSSKFQRDGEFYTLQIDKQDAFKLVEDRTTHALKRKEYLALWQTLPKDKMLEEAFLALIFGDQNRAEAVRELVALKDKELKDEPLFQALKIRLAMREAQVSMDEYNDSLLETALDNSKEAIEKLGSSKFATLLQLEIARIRRERSLENLHTQQYLALEEDTVLKSMFTFQNLVHSDPAKALETLEAAKSINPKSPYLQNYLRHRIHIHRHAKDLARMEEDLKLLFAETSPTPEDLAQFANLLKEKRDYPAALSAVEKCLTLDHSNKACNELKEEVMTTVAFEKQKENQDEAINYLTNALMDHPASVAVNKGLGFLYRMKGEQDKSINHYSIACAMEDSISCTEAGESLSRMGEHEKALLLFDVSCDLKSGSGCLKAGLHAEKNGQHERSGNYFERSCNELNETSGCYHLARNMQQKHASNKEIAPYLNRACKLYPSACKLASIYQNTNKQPPIPPEPN
jgi:tetratricopeptide (TPR) repeat protein